MEKTELLDKIEKDEEKIHRLKQIIFKNLKENTTLTIDELIEEENLRHNVALGIYKSIMLNLKSVNKTEIILENKPTMNKMREIAKCFIEGNAGSANSSEILEECNKRGYNNISKQDIANALSQGGMFVFQRGENNSKKFGKWIVKK